jgi:phosphatidylserine/phosphatidylglycerophosphate/cardiolipin synthase-like enzyme
MEKTEFITNEQIYNRVIQEKVPFAEKFLWIATADIKDLHVAKGSKWIPFLEVLSDLVDRDISIRLIHAKEPGPAFRRDFDKYPNLIDGLERILCPRVHFKSIIVDGSFAYTGSANLTGAGVGAKSADNRNFENGIITTDEKLIGQIMEQFDNVWIGTYCGTCNRKQYCADYKDVFYG